MDMIQELVGLGGVSGNESAVLAYIKKQITPFADKVYEDRLGNLVAVKHGNGPRVLLTACTDLAGLIFTSADNDGFLYVNAIGELDLSSLIGSTVVFLNGVQGIFSSFAKKDIQIKDCFVDIGAKNCEEAKAHVPPGTTAVFKSSFVQMGSRFSSYGLNGRLGCFCLMEVLRRLNKPSCEAFFAFTVQNAVGFRGAGVVCRDIDPELAIAVGTIEESKGSEKDRSAVSIGKGAAVKICDHTAVCSLEIIEDLENLAQRKGIALQRNVFCSGESETGVFQKNGMGVKTGGIGIPIRYPHSAAETADRADVEATVAVVTAYLEK